MNAFISSVYFSCGIGIYLFYKHLPGPAASSSFVCLPSDPPYQNLTNKSTVQYVHAKTPLSL